MEPQRGRGSITASATIPRDKARARQLAILTGLGHFPQVKAGPFLPTLLDFVAGTMDAAGGAVAEWLGKGLQSPVHRFDSGPRL